MEITSNSNVEDFDFNNGIPSESLGLPIPYIPDYLIELGFLSRERLDVRTNIIKWYGLLVPFLGFCLYAGFQNPVLMVTISASVAAIMLPVQSGITIYLQTTRLPQEVRPGKLASGFLKITFVFQLIMALLVIYFVVI